MKIYAIPSAAEADPVKTEEWSAATAALCEPGPLVGYLDAPWRDMLNGKMDLPTDQEMQDVRVWAKDNEFDYVVTTCQHVKFQNLISRFIMAGVTHLYTPHCTLKAQDFFKSRGIILLPIPHAPVVLKYPEGSARPKVRERLFSFRGMNNHPVRRAISAAKKERTMNNITLTGQWMVGQPSLNYAMEMCETTFALCPRGVGPGTIRISEAILAGAIPVIISDDYVLPEGLWQTACIRLRETMDFEKLEHILGDIASYEDAMQERWKAMKVLQVTDLDVKNERFGETVFCDLEFLPKTRQIRAYALVTKSHLPLLAMMAETVPSDIKLEVHHAEQTCNGRFAQAGWNETMQKKVQMLINACDNNPQGAILLHVDVDIQFFDDAIIEIIKSYLTGADFVGQRDGEEGKPEQMCGGFFAFRNNAWTRKLFVDVLALMIAESINDQVALNRVLRESGSTAAFFPKDQVWSPRRHWDIGQEIRMPKNAAVVHSNWMIGVESKILHMEGCLKLREVWKREGQWMLEEKATTT